MLCNDIHIDLDQSKSHQPDHLISKLPRTDSYEDSCNKLMLPNLEIDEMYVPNSNNSPLFSSDIREIEADGENLTVRQKMRKGSEVHITGSRVIIDDLMLRSTSLALLLLLLECYLRVYYFKYRTTLKLA